MEYYVVLQSFDANKGRSSLLKEVSSCTAEEAISEQCSPAIQNMSALADHTSVNTGYKFKVNCSNATVYIRDSCQPLILPKAMPIESLCTFTRSNPLTVNVARPLPIIYIPVSVDLLHNIRNSLPGPDLFIIGHTHAYPFYIKS